MNRLAALLLVVALCGCTAPTVIQLDGHEIEYESMESARFPSGAQVTNLNRERTLLVAGTDPILVNGDEVRTEDGILHIGGHQLRVATHQRVLVDRSGEVRLVASPKYVPTTVAASAPRH